MEGLIALVVGDKCYDGGNIVNHLAESMTIIDMDDKQDSEAINRIVLANGDEYLGIGDDESGYRIVKRIYEHIEPTQECLYRHLHAWHEITIEEFQELIKE